MRVFLAAVAVVLAAAACGGSGQAASGGPGPPSSPRPGGAARLTIITPAGGAVIHARTVHVKVRLTGANTENPATTTQALPGYIHLYLDSKIISIAPVASNDSVTDQTISRVKPGRHMLKAEFVGPGHLPFRPRVIAVVTFAVRG